MKIEKTNKTIKYRLANVHRLIYHAVTYKNWRVQELRVDGWMEQCFTSPPTQYRLYGRRFLQVKRLNQQYQSTEGTHTVDQ